MSSNNAFAKAAKAVLNAYDPEVPVSITLNNHGVPSDQSDIDYEKIEKLHNELLPYYLEYIQGGNKLSAESVSKVLGKESEFIELGKLKKEYINKYASTGVYNYGAKPLTDLKKSRKSRKNRKSRKSRKNRKSRSN